MQLLVAELGIGHRGEEGLSSGLVDNCFFIIDGEVLRYVPLTELRILSEEQFNVRRSPLQPRKERRFLQSLMATAIPASPLGKRHDISESLDCTGGLPQAHFQQLLESCLDGRISRVHLHGIGGALSSNFSMAQRVT